MIKFICSFGLYTVDKFTALLRDIFNTVMAAHEIPERENAHETVRCHSPVTATYRFYRVLLFNGRWINTVGKTANCKNLTSSYRHHWRILVLLIVQIQTRFFSPVFSAWNILE